MIDARYVQKHDTEENWLKAINFTPLEGELIVYEPDANHFYPRYKIGDGKTNVNQLPFSNEQISENELKNILTNLDSHNFDTETIVKIDCLNQGFKYLTCSTCGEIKFIGIPPLNPDYGHAIGEPYYIIEPTCIQDGLAVVGCQDCDYEYQFTVEASPVYSHETYNIHFSDTHHWYSCSACGEDYIDKALHRVSSWEIISETDGIQTLQGTCQNNDCNAVATHEHNRYTQGGQICKYCKQTIDPIETEETSCSHPEEYRTNYHSTGGGVHWYDCTLCGNESVAFDVCDNYLEYVRVDSDNHCTKCSLCGEVFEDDLSAHVYGEPYYNLDMDYENYHYRDCVDCGYLGMFPHDYTELGAISTDGHTLACVCGGSEIEEQHYNDTDGTMTCSLCGAVILDA